MADRDLLPARRSLSKDAQLQRPEAGMAEVHGSRAEQVQHQRSLPGSAAGARDLFEELLIAYAPAVTDRFAKLRPRIDRAVFFATVLRASKVVQPIRPANFAQFVRGARQTKPGPHMALMFHAAAHPDKEAIVEYGEHGVRRITWG